MDKLKWFILPALMLALTGVFALAQEREAEKPADAEKKDEAKAEADKPKEAELGKAAPDFTLKNAEGKEVKFSDFKGKMVVLEWINFDCPWCKAHYDGKDELIKMQDKVREDGGVWLYICSSGEGKQGNFQGDALTERLKKEKVNGAYYLIDADGKVGKTYKAATTPHTYVIDKEGVLRYRGALDNLPQQRRGNAEPVNYVNQVLESLKAGEEIAETDRRPYG